MTGDARPAIRFDHVGKVYRAHSAHRDGLHALADISLEVRENEFVSLLGPSGCGKSTLLMLTAGLRSISDGTIELRGRRVAAPQTVAAQLGAEPLAQVIRRRQTTIRDGATVALLTSWVPASLGEAVPELLGRARITDEIEGYRPAWGEDPASARPPTSAEAREFGIKRGSPVTVVHSRRFAADDSVIEYAELIARADTRVTYRYEYRPAGA